MKWLDFWKRTEKILRGKIVQPDGLGYTISFTFSGFPNEQPEEGLMKSRSLEHCTAEFKTLYLRLKEDFERETGHQLIETETYRSPDTQFEYFKQGREFKDGAWVIVDPDKVVTNCDGHKKKSRHNMWRSEAVDVAVDVDPGPGKHIKWDIRLYRPLGPLACRYGLRWGGDWDGDGDSSDQSVIDAPHIQMGPI